MDTALVLRALEGASALVVGLVDEGGRPYATRAWALVVTPTAQGVRARVVIDARDAEHLVRSAGRGVVATTATDVFTLRSVQAKGPVVAVEDATAADRAAVVAYKDSFFDAVLAIDNVGRDLMERMVPAAFVAVTFDVEEAFDQTPGPGAGKPVTA